MKALCYVTLLVGAIILCSCEAVLTLRPIGTTQPSEFAQPVRFVFIYCEIVASFPLNGSSVESRWFLPNGTVVNIHDGIESKYEIIQGIGPDEYETNLLIQPIIYSDAGNYTCEVRDTRDPNDIGDWISVQATLVLLVELTANNMEVRVSNGEAQVSLSCEMSLYIHPDENLKWYRGEEEISPGSGRYTIVYSDGTLIGQFGGDIPGPSRVSTLVISQPQMSDSDNYTCLIINTQHMQDIQLTVDHVAPSTTSCSMDDDCTDVPTANTTMTSTKNITTSSDEIPVLELVVGALVLTLIVTTVIILFVVVQTVRRRKKAPPTINDYIQPPPLPHRITLEDNYAYGKATPAIDLEASGGMDTDVKDNIAYGVALLPENDELEGTVTHEGSAPNDLGLFLAPVLQPNAAYAAAVHTPNTDSDGYELTQPSQSYEAPNPPSLTAV